MSQTLQHLDGGQPSHNMVGKFRIANEDVEGILQGFTGGEAAVTAVIGAAAGALLMRVETGNKLVNAGAKALASLALYGTYKASERALEAGRHDLTRRPFVPQTAGSYPSNDINALG